jgi:cytochrome P450
MTENVMENADIMQDPHGVYERLRAVGPVHRAVLPKGVPLFGGLPVWVVASHTEVRAALTHPGLSTDLERMTPLFAKHGADSTKGSFSIPLAKHMLHADPPDHTRMRNLVNTALTSRAVRKLQPRIEEITDDLLEKLAGRDVVDLLDEFAFPLPVTVICEMFGVPAEDRANFTTWAKNLVSGPSIELVTQSQGNMFEYLGKLTADKRARPADDILSTLVQDHEIGRLDDSELVPMAFLLLVGGHETTSNLLGNGLLSLLRDRPWFDALLADPSMWPDAIEELLRYDGPAKHGTFRFTTTEVQLGGHTIPAGELVLVSLISANRDKEKWLDADVMNLRRKPGQHLTFGHGIHYCVGAPLARLEAHIAFGKLLPRFPKMELAVEPDDLVWRASTLVKGLTTLPIRLKG